MSRYVRALAIAGLILAISTSALAGGPDTLWTRTFGWDDHWVSPGDRGSGIDLTEDGGAIMTGSGFQFELTPEEAFMIKLDRYGRAEWERFCCTWYRESGLSVICAPAGGYVMAGFAEVPPERDWNVLLTYTDENGYLGWKRTYAGPGPAYGRAVATSVLPAHGGGYIVGAYTEDVESRHDDIYILRTDEKGDTLWARTYGGGRTERFESMVRDEFSGGYLICGLTYSDDWLGQGLLLLKIDEGGDTLWTRVYDPPDLWVNGARVDQTGDGGYILGANVDLNTSSWGLREYHIQVIRVDAAGDTLWTRLLGGAGSDNCSDIIQTSDGGSALLGSTDSFGAGGFDVYLVRMDASGDTLWTRTYGGPHTDFGSEVVETPEGSYMIVGTTSSFGVSMSDAFVIKTRPDPVHGGSAPPGLAVSEAWPNPVMTGTAFTVELTAPGEITTTVYDVLGRLVAGPTTVQAGYGFSEVPVQVENWDGEPLNSGIYFCTIEAAGRSETRKLVFVR